MELKTGRAILEELIDSYCGIANSNNMGKSKTDSDIALAIGDLSAKNPDAKEDLRILLTKDNCTAGMRAYVQEFDGSELVTLAEEIGDNGQYINVLRSKFDADAANWVWNVETAQQKIREVILEYRIIAESNKVIPKNVSFSSTKSFAVMLTDIDEVKSFLNSRISSEPYEWFGLPEVDKKLEQMAEDKYIREGCTRALEKIDGMDVGDVKRYLKELIKDNMIVGMEIIKEN